MKDVLIKYARENNIVMNDGETYLEIYNRCIEDNPSLHTVKEIREFAKQLMKKLYNEFDEDLKALMVFARYPLIYTKGYHGFNEVYLYEHIHNAMGYYAKSFCVLNKIEEDIEKKILEHEISDIWSKKFGFFPTFDPFGDATELIQWMEIIRRHNFNPNYIEHIEDDIKIALIKSGDKYFHEQNLTDVDTIILLYEMVAITYGFHNFNFTELFTRTDGYGHIVYEHDKDFICNDFSIYKTLYQNEVI